MDTELTSGEHRSGLPICLTKFFGRETEVQVLVRALADPTLRAMTLIGPGGVGKTRLATEAIRRVAPTLEGDFAFIDGAMLEHPAMVLPEIADRMDIERSSGQPVGELISEALAGRTLLLVLDNMEHLLPASVDIAALLRALPGLRVLATSRSSLRIAEEQIIAVEPLANDLRGSNSREWWVAGRLFLDRAARAGKPIAVDDSTRAIVETICAQLDGLPLAIELAAARLKLFSLTALQSALTRQLVILTGGPGDVSERHQTLRAAIDWSFSLLTSEEQRLLRELGVFVDSFTLEAARAVCTSGEQLTEDLLESIYDQALLVRLEDDIDGEPRFRMLTSIREFAIERLRASGNEATLQARHAAWARAFVESLMPHLHGDGQHQAVVRLDRMAPNLRLAFSYSVTERDRDAALRMAVALQRYWRVRAHWDEGRAAFEAALALGEPESTRLWGSALRGAAIFAEVQFDHEAALGLNERAIAVWESLGDRSGMAISLIDLGNVNNNLGRFDDAIAAFAQAAELAGDAELRTSLVARGSMASAMLRKGALEDADLAYRIVVPLLREIGDPSLLSTILSNQAVVRQRLGDVAEAQQLLHECLDMQEKLGDDYGLSATLVNLADLEHEPAAKARYASNALEIASRINALDVTAAVYANLGDVALATGDVLTAAERFVDALDDYAAIGDELGQADMIGLIAAASHETNAANATRLISAAATIYARNNVQPTSPQALRAASLQDQLRSLLGTEEYERACATGRNWSLDETVLEARALARSQRARTPAVRVQPMEPLFGKLTPRELDVLRLIAAGKSNRDIADTLFITVRTANHHVARILAKLECRNRAGAAALAYQHGLIPTP